MDRVRETLIGSRIPDAAVAIEKNDKFFSVNIAKLVNQGNHLIVGVPGAFTPICTCEHLPNLVENADNLKRTGFQNIFCVAASDPFTLSYWKDAVDPDGKISFLSDGNLEFARALQLVCNAEDLFLGTRSERYLINVKNGVITRVRVEDHYTAFDKTDPAKIYPKFGSTIAVRKKNEASTEPKPALQNEQEEEKFFL